MVLVNGRTKEQQGVVNYIVSHMEKANLEELETLYEMEANLYLSGALNEREHEGLESQIRRWMRRSR